MSYLSVITGVHNRPQIVDLTLRSILRTEANPEDFEIIVVDDGSTDNTDCWLESIESWYEGYHITIIGLSDNTASPGKARNIGYKASSGEIIAFLDSDMIHFCDPIKATIDYFSCGTNYHNYLVSGEWSLVRNDGSRYYTDKPPSVINERQTIPFAAWLALKRTHIDEIGGFDERFGYACEDNLFNTCMNRLGLRGVKMNLYAVHQYYKAKGYKMPTAEEREIQLRWLRDHKGHKVNEGVEWGKI